MQTAGLVKTVMTSMMQATMVTRMMIARKMKAARMTTVMIVMMMTIEMKVVTVGIGLSNTRERLRQLYGDRQHLRLVSLPEGGVDVQVVIPYHNTSMGPWNGSGH